jgi:hypothetical protein
VIFLIVLTTVWVIGLAAILEPDLPSRPLPRVRVEVVDECRGPRQQIVGVPCARLLAARGG